MKRNDAKQVFDIPVYNKIFPFMLKRRCDSLVYHSVKLDVTKTVEYIRAYNATKPEFRLRFFYVFSAALMRTIALRPELNRFIASNRFWQRNELSMTFVVKEDYTDDAPETSTPIYFRPDMTLMEYAKVMDEYITKARENSENNNTDSMIKLLMHVPYWAIGLFIKVLRFMENRGYAANFMRDADGLHTSVFVSNLGSIGLVGGSPHHHLYEWGTTSLFVTLGGMERIREMDEDGKLKTSKQVVEIGATLDERVSSGFYFVKSIYVLQDLLDHPEKLEEVPVLPPPPLTRKEWKKKVRRESKEAKKVWKENISKPSKQTENQN